MTSKQWSAWLLAAGITTLIAVVSIDFEGDGTDMGTASISLTNMTEAQKDSVVRAELARANVGDEIVSLRKADTKVWKEKNGELSASIYAQPKHYLDEADSVYKPIDLTIRDISALAKLNPLRKLDRYVDAGLYRATWFESKPWDYTLWRGDDYVTYTALFSATKTVTIVTEPLNTGFKQSVVISDSSSLTSTYAWLIESNLTHAYKDSETVFGAGVFTIPRAVAWDAQNVPIPVLTTLRGDTLRYSLDLPAHYTIPVTIDPTTLINASNYISTLGLRYLDAVYLTARNATSYTDNLSNPTFGQKGPSTYSVYRAHFHFDTSSLPDDAILDSAKVSLSKVTQDNDYDHSFNAHLIQSTASGSEVQADWFNDFVGWASSGTYSITDLAPALLSSNYAVNDTIKFTLNATGLTKISLTDSTRFFVLSDRDISSTQPDGYEYLQVNTTGAYIQVWYHEPPFIKAPTNFRLDNPTTTSLRTQYTRNHSAYVDSVGIVDQNGAHIKYFDSVTDTVTTITGLATNTQYIFRCFVDSLGVKNYSNFDTLKTSEAAPGNFTLTVLSPDSIHATWTDNADSEEWFVLLTTVDSTQVAGTDTLPPNTTSITVGNLTPNTLYEWFVKTRLATGDSTSSSASDRTQIRLPGTTVVTTLSPYTLRFIVAPEDNPYYTQYALQDSITGLYADSSAEPETLRVGPPGDWGWKTFSQWGGVQGDTLTGLLPDSLYVIRVKARTGE